MRQDHDRTVREARDNMVEFDRRRDLERWLQNYVHPQIGVPAAYWCACTKVEKRWRIEYGLLTGTDPVAWCWADPGAPEPPILQFRRPKPEVVKPRFRGKIPFQTPSFTPLLDDLLADMSRKIMASMFIPTDATANSANESSFTLEKMRAMLDDLPPDWRGPARRPLYQPIYVGADYGDQPSYTALRYLSFLPPPEISESTLRYLREIDILDLPLPPPPEPTKRNQ